MANDSFFRRYRDPIVILFLLVLPFVLYVSNSKEARDHNFFDRFVVFVSTPVQWLVRGTVEGVIGAWQHYVYLVDTEEQNLAMAQELGRMRAELAKREEMRIENERLRALVGLRDRAPEVAMQHARIIAIGSTPLFRSVRIDRGSDDGVEVGSAVITSHGVVGRVAAVAGDYSDVMLLVDANSSTDVLVQRTRARARVRGGGGDDGLSFAVEYLPRTADVQPGDVLITSGVGRVFPKGLRVGTVVSTEQRNFGLYQKAVVSPSVDFTKLEDVMVVTSQWPEHTTFETPGDLEQGPVSPELIGTGEGLFPPNAVEITAGAQ